VGSQAGRTDAAASRVRRHEEAGPTTCRDSSFFGNYYDTHGHRRGESSRLDKPVDEVEKFLTNMADNRADSPSPPPALQQVIRLISRSGHDRFWGKVTIEFKDGVIAIIRREEIIKPL
jgi:hypothetical protein